jgi:hypothetical protein
VDRPRHEFLAGAGLPGDQDGDVYEGSRGDDVEDVLHSGADPEGKLSLDPRERILSIGGRAIGSPERVGVSRRAPYCDLRFVHTD